MNRTRLTVIVTALLAISLTLTGSASVVAAGTSRSIGQQSSAGAAAHHRRHRKPRQMAMGVSMLPYDDQATYDKFVTASGRAPAIWSMWADWGGTNAKFPSGSFLNHMHSKGTAPLIIWEPVDPANPTSTAFQYDRILAGDWDAYITKFAQDAKAYHYPVLVRFAHEMDGAWFPWSVQVPPNTPRKFVRAWQHVWNIFKGTGGVGAKNVKFIWSPIKPCACERNLYPGDKYVDYTAFTAFNWGGSDGARTMKGAYENKIKAMLRLTKKPIIIAETGSTPKGKADWITRGYPAVYKAFPSVKAIVYFSVDMTFNEQPDWRLTTPSSAMSAYKRIAAKTQFKGHIK